MPGDAKWCYRVLSLALGSIQRETDALSREQGQNSRLAASTESTWSPATVPPSDSSLPIRTSNQSMQHFAAALLAGGLVAV
nr:hypothetical protein KitaXyl93_53860 [Kitasatospora sp. Xyl93]